MNKDKILNNCVVITTPTDICENSIVVYPGSMNYQEGRLTRDYLSSVGAESHHIHIILGKQKIKENDPVFDPVINKAFIAESGIIGLPNKVYKVIASTDPELSVKEIKGSDSIIQKAINTPGISRKFIDRFCSNNGKITDVNVEFNSEGLLETREDNTIIIHKSKNYSLSDIIDVVSRETNSEPEDIVDWFKN